MPLRLIGLVSGQAWYPHSMRTRDLWTACCALSFGMAASCNPATPGRRQPAAASQSTPATAEAPASVSTTASPRTAPVPRWSSAELGALASQTDPAVWKPKLGELVRATLEGAVDEELVFPHIGSLRDKLLAAMNDPTWQEKDHRGFSLALWGRYLLSLWSDPRDEALVKRWLEERKDFATAAPAGLTGSTIEEALEKWRDHHFASEGIPKGKPRTSNQVRILARSGDHALAEHDVRYMHWGYATQLVLTKSGDQWGLRIVMHTRTDHFD